MKKLTKVTDSQLAMAVNGLKPLKWNDIYEEICSELYQTQQAQIIAGL